MTERTQGGLSARQLILFFFAGVAVCGVFFALGFLVGYHEQGPGRGVAADSERVTQPSDIPPTVNPPTERAKPTTQPATPGASAKGDEQPSEEDIAPAPSRERQASSSQGPRTARAESSAAAAQSKPSDKAGLGVQVVALSSRQAALMLVSALKGRGYAAFLLSPEGARAADKLFRVEVGPFGSRAEAEKIRRKLAAEGYKPFIRD
jgi:DedD protein